MSKTKIGTDTGICMNILYMNLCIFAVVINIEQVVKVKFSLEKCACLVHEKKMFQKQQAWGMLNIQTFCPEKTLSL